jgi:hypothetical protein
VTPSGSNYLREDGLKDRSTSRVRSVLKAEIRYNDGLMSVPCVVRDISATGARLELAGDVQLPASFDLFIDKRNETRRVDTKWRRGMEIGVAFEPAARLPASTATDVEERLARLEREMQEVRTLLAGIAAALERRKS